MDWAGLMRLGLGRLRLTPAAFWALTPIELLIILGVDGVSPALTRSRLDEMARSYPDRKKECGDGT